MVAEEHSLSLSLQAYVALNDIALILNVMKGKIFGQILGGSSGIWVSRLITDFQLLKNKNVLTALMELRIHPFIIYSSIRAALLQTILPYKSGN